jgi:sugar phosphate isomerase/epimerase
VLGRFRCGVVHYAAFPKCLDDHDTFWRTLELLLSDPALDAIEVHTFLPPSWLDELRGKFRTAGKQLFLSAGPRLIDEEGLCALNVSERGMAVNLCKELIDMAHELSATNLMLVSGKDHDPKSRSYAYAALDESLGELCRYALSGQRRDSLTISLETFPRAHSPQQLVGPTVEALKLANQVFSINPNFRMTLDLSHFAQLREDPVESLRAFASHARHIHMSTCVMVPDHPLFGDQHPSFETPDTAVTLDIAGRALATALQENGDQDINVSVEVCPQSWEDPVEVLATARANLLKVVTHARRLTPLD